MSQHFRLPFYPFWGDYPLAFLDVHCRTGVLTHSHTLTRCKFSPCSPLYAEAYVLTLNESVTEIDLRCKEFGAEGMKVGAQKSDGLFAWRASGTADSLQVLTAALKENKQVTKINLERCIGDVGAQARVRLNFTVSLFVEAPAFSRL